MGIDWNKDKSMGAFITQVVEPQLLAVRELTIEMALIKASLQHIKDEQGKLTKYVLEGNGRPSLTEKVNAIEDRVRKIEQNLEETETTLDLIPDRVSEIKEQIESITETHVGHSNKMKWVLGTLTSIILVLIPLIWNSTPHLIKWIELQKYNMRLYDQYIQQGPIPKHK